MPRPEFPRSVLEFQRRFSTEEACLQYLIESRWPDGFRCPRCEHPEAFWISNRRVFQCKACRHQASVTAGTVMHRSRTPLTTWFWGAYLVTTHTPGMSAMQFQRQTNLPSYETAFQMLHKLRSAMVSDNREPLHGTVEIDETLIGGKEKGVMGRRGEKKVMVVGAVEVRGEYAGRIRLQVVRDATTLLLSRFIANNVRPGSTIKTDGWHAYPAVSVLGYKHVPEVQGPRERSSEILPHIHRVFSNLKAWLIGTHHGVSPQHLQAYLNEYTFRFNRRKTPMAAFQTVLGLSTGKRGPSYSDIYKVNKKEPRKRIGSPAQSKKWAHPIGSVVLS
jgi:transposase-like protein